MRTGTPIGRDINSIGLPGEGLGLYCIYRHFGGENTSLGYLGMRLLFATATRKCSRDSDCTYYKA